MDMDTPITRGEHEEFVRRMQAENKRLADEDKRQNHRIDELEETMHQIGALTTQVEKLAVSLESMVKEQEKQGERLDCLESRDGEMWRKVTGYVITAVICIAIGFFFKQIGMQEKKYLKEEKQKGETRMFQNNVFQPSINTKQWVRAAGIRAVKT